MQRSLPAGPSNFAFELGWLAPSWPSTAQVEGLVPTKFPARPEAPPNKLLGTWEGSEQLAWTPGSKVSLFVGPQAQTGEV